MEELLLDEEVELLGNPVYEGDYGNLYVVGKEAVVIAATNTYIPIENFKEIFTKAGELIKEKGLKKVVFDKRKLMVFHQPSMIWYFTEWKEEMYDNGLHIHRKLLPRDPVFRECVKLGREKINAEYPDAKFNLMDIQYKNSLEEAINS